MSTDINLDFYTDYEDYENDEEVRRIRDLLAGKKTDEPEERKKPVSVEPGLSQQSVSPKKHKKLSQAFGKKSVPLKIYLPPDDVNRLKLMSVLCSKKVSELVKEVMQKEIKLFFKNVKDNNRLDEEMKIILKEL